MTIKTDLAEPCWEPFDVTAGQGYWRDQDRWPHYPTRAKCDEAVAEIIGDLDPADHPDGMPRVESRPCFAGPCVVIECDGCGEQFDYEGDGGMHFDPADPMPVSITECDWTVEERAGQPDRHYCPECQPAWCDDCDERHHGACLDTPRPVPVIDGQLSLVDG